jgi:hypothetical protein
LPWRRAVGEGEEGRDVPSEDQPVGSKRKRRKPTSLKAHRPQFHRYLNARARRFRKIDTAMNQKARLHRPNLLCSGPDDNDLPILLRPSILGNLQLLDTSLMYL